MSVPSLRTPLWALIGLSGVAAVLVGVRVHRPTHRWPWLVLAVDKSFIDGIPEDPQQVALVEGIVHLADTLGLQVIAEGIEEQPQRDLLADIGCRYGQGFLFARPLTVGEGEAVLRQRNDGRRSGPDH